MTTTEITRERQRQGAKLMWGKRSEEDRRKLSAKLSNIATAREKRNRILRDQAPCCILCVFWVRVGEGDMGECHKDTPSTSGFPSTSYDTFCGEHVSAYDEKFDELIHKKHFPDPAVAVDNIGKCEYRDQDRVCSYPGHCAFCGNVRDCQDVPDEETGCK